MIPKMKIYRYLSTTVSLFMLYMISAHAQDFNYSQYQHTPIIINPALIAENKQILVTSNYYHNRLWESLNMQNYQFSLTSPLNFIKNEEMPQGMGISLMHNSFSKNGILNYTRGNLAFSQGVTLNKSISLSAGFIASVCFISNKTSDNYTTGSQWIEGTGYDPLTGINENINYETEHLFSIGTGLNMHIRDGEVSKGDFGIALFHINKPNYSFLNDENAINTRYIIYGNYRLMDINRLSVTPRILLINQDINLASFGVLFNYSFKSDNPYLFVKNCNLQLGLDYRSNRSGIVSFNVEQPDFIIGFSYAMGLSRENAYSINNSNFEVCLVFKFNQAKKTSKNTSEYYVGDTRLIFNDGLDNNKPAQTNNVNNFNSDSVVIRGKKYKVQLQQDFKFKFNDANLTEEAHQYLDDLAGMLQQNKNLKVEVIGHTDDVGSDEANLIVSERRAKVVIDYLVSRGINQNRLKPTAKSKTEPLFLNDTEENRSKNRRVEFIIYNE